MAHNEGKVLGMDLNEFGDIIGKRFQDKFPHSGLFPSAKVTVGSGESPSGDIVQAQILITMNREDAIGFWTPNDDTKKAMEVMKPKILIIGDERIKDGLFVLFSKLEANMLCIKFSTKAEAIAYSQHFGLTHYHPVLVKIAVSQDRWFDGDFSKCDPKFMGTREIDPRAIGGGDNAS